ncbi:MAG: polyphosphate kinase 1 [Chitinivibrionales bacterium]|nr:polyphosphate kinase 1 [Chitinivibrionales bacterium]
MARKTAQFNNRELSWLEFNQRVLDEADCESVPPLERLKFLAITSSNLDEFFMVRVGGLTMLDHEGIAKPDIAGLSPAKQLEAIDTRVRKMVDMQYSIFNNQLKPRLTKEGIQRVDSSMLSTEELLYIDDLFSGKISAMVTPMAVHSPEILSKIMNLTIHMAVRLKPAEGELKPRFAIIPIGINTDRIIPVPSKAGYRYILLEDIICTFIERLFPGEPIAECTAFRITRNADMTVREDSAADLLSEMENVLIARKTSDCVRLEVAVGTSKTMLNFLQKGLNAGERETYEIDGPLNLGDFMKLAAINGFEKLAYKPWIPQQSPSIETKTGMFTTLTKKNILLYHPYESFEPVLRLIDEAADDPDVLAIKQILYRTSRHSPIIAALKRAAQGGKYVTVLVELKARFDEARNIEWAQELEQAGVQVIYGVKGYKTHAKLLIIVRKELRGIIRYLHFGTGNYNESTARLYSDISYMTTDPDLGADASSFFNAITGYSQPQPFAKLSAAPMFLREKIIEMIETETERKRHGQRALIMAKMNSLVDKTVIRALYKASQEGVRVMLNVRGICCLRPGVPGLSENIKVISIIDRFLEHARIFYFYHGGEEKVFLSSADMMPRNLDKRVELLVPVDDSAAKRRLKQILETHFKDEVKGRILTSDGSYIQPETKGKRKKVRSQEALYLQACEAIKQHKQHRRTVFEPHKPPDASY